MSIETIFPLCIAHQNSVKLDTTASACNNQPSICADLYFMRLILCCLFAGCLLAACTTPGPTPSDAANSPATAESFEAPRSEEVDFRIRDEHSNKLDAGATVRIENPWGDIRVRKSDRRGVVEITMASQRIGPDWPGQPELRMDQSPTEFSVTTAFPGGRVTGDGRNARIDLMVMVPAGHTMEFRTRDGAIKAKKTIGSVAARSDSGSIKIINDGPIRASSESGQLQVRPMYPGWGELALSSATGKVVAFLPDPANLQIEIGLIADVHSDWPLKHVASGYRLEAVPAASAVDHVVVNSAASVELYRATVEPGLLEVAETQVPGAVHP